MACFSHQSKFLGLTSAFQIRFSEFDIYLAADCSQNTESENMANWDGR